MKSHRTIVYIDGFNFYYGALKGTPWKWLDLEKLFRTLLVPENDVVTIKYFTARVRPTASNPEVHTRQEIYLRALAAHCSSLEIYFGHILRHRIHMENADPPPDRVRVWKNEEKGSDVNLALHVLNDAWQGAYDCAVIASNDSDLCESLRLVREQHHKVIGLVTPGAPRRTTSRQLLRQTHFVKPIRVWALEANQLPDVIPGTALRKPASW